MNNQNNIQQNHCPQCPNHCPKDNLLCERGRRFFGDDGCNGKTEGEHQRKFVKKEGIEGSLRGLGHYLHHNTDVDFPQKLNEALSIEEQKELQRLLEKLLKSVDD